MKYTIVWKLIFYKSFVFEGGISFSIAIPTFKPINFGGILKVHIFFSAHNPKCWSSVHWSSPTKLIELKYFGVIPKYFNSMRFVGEDWFSWGVPEVCLRCTGVPDVMMLPFPKFPQVSITFHVQGEAAILYPVHSDGLVQERRNSSVLAMELRLSCTNLLTSSYINVSEESAYAHESCDRNSSLSSPWILIISVTRKL